MRYFKILVFPAKGLVYQGDVCISIAAAGSGARGGQKVNGSLAGRARTITRGWSLSGREPANTAPGFCEDGGNTAGLVFASPCS